MELIVWMLTVFMIASSIVAQETEEPNISPVEFLTQVNNKRRELAKNKNISNMHEMTWNTNLVQEMIENKEINGDTIQDTHAETYANSYREILDGINNGEMIEFSKNDRAVTGGVQIEFFCPLHKNIGCNHFNSGHYPLRCYMSPRQDYEQAETWKEVGPPGSKCNDGYANNDGLCSLIGSFTTEAPPTTAPVIAKKSPQEQESDTTEVDQASSSGTIIPILQLSTVLVLHFLFHF